MLRIAGTITSWRGTLEELCKALGRTRRNLMWYLAPSSKRRQEGQRQTKRRLTLVLVEE